MKQTQAPAAHRTLILFNFDPIPKSRSLNIQKNLTPPYIHIKKFPWCLFFNQTKEVDSTTKPHPAVVSPRWSSGSPSRKPATWNKIGSQPAMALPQGALSSASRRRLVFFLKKRVAFVWGKEVHPTRTGQLNWRFFCQSLEKKCRSIKFFCKK